MIQAFRVAAVSLCACGLCFYSHLVGSLLAPLIYFVYHLHTWHSTIVYTHSSASKSRLIDSAVINRVDVDNTTDLSHPLKVCIKSTQNPFFCSKYVPRFVYHEQAVNHVYELAVYLKIKHILNTPTLRSATHVSADFRCLPQTRTVSQK